MKTYFQIKRLLIFTSTFLVFGALVLVAEVDNSFALVVSEGFEQESTLFDYSSENNTPFTVHSTDVVRTGSCSFKVGSTDCHNHCYDPSHSVFSQHILSSPAFVDSVVFWAREGSSSGFGWGAWFLIGHDGIWDDSRDIVENGSPITGEWVRVVTSIDAWSSSVEFLVEDMTDLSSMWIDDFEIYIDETVSSVDGVPNYEAVSLRQNYPNPFNPSTSIEFKVFQNTQLSILVVDVSGRIVNTLVNNKNFGPGSHFVEWNGRNGSEREMPSGVYFYRVKGAGFAKMGKMVLLR